MIPFIFATSRNIKVDRLIGEISYPLYIVHGPHIGIVFDNDRWNHIGQEILAAALSITAASLMFRYIDKPIDAWRHRRFIAGKNPSAPAKMPWVTAAALTVGLIGYTLALDAFAKAEPPRPFWSE